MDYSAFYDRCQQLPEKDKQWVDAFYRTVVETFDEEIPQYSNLNRICRLFYGRGASLSKSQYYRQRNFVRMFYDWLKEQGAVDETVVQQVYALQLKDVVSDYELTRYYFKDLDGVLDFVKLVGSMKDLGTSDDLLNIKTIVILTWYGVKLSEMLTIKKSDLYSSTNSVMVGERTIKLTTEYFNILRRFAELDMHKGFPSQKKQVYVYSTYLMRSAKQEQMSPNNVQKALSRFNAVAVDYGKELSILNLRRNGIFSAVHQAEDDRTVNTLIQELINCDTAFAFGYKEFYERWKSLFIGGDAC